MSAKDWIRTLRRRGVEVKGRTELPDGSIRIPAPGTRTDVSKKDYAARREAREARARAVELRAERRKDDMRKQLKETGELLMRAKQRRAKKKRRR